MTRVAQFKRWLRRAVLRIDRARLRMRQSEMLAEARGQYGDSLTQRELVRVSSVIRKRTDQLEALQ